MVGPPPPQPFRTPPQGAGRTRHDCGVWPGSGILLPEEETPMMERQKEAWAAILLTALTVGLLLGGWLVLHLAEH